MDELTKTRRRLAVLLTAALAAAIPARSERLAVGPSAQGCPFEELAEAIAAAHANGEVADEIFLVAGHDHSFAGPLVIDLAAAGDLLLSTAKDCSGEGSFNFLDVDIESGDGLIVNGGGAGERTLRLEWIDFRPAAGATIGRVLDVSGSARVIALGSSFRGGAATEGAGIRISGAAASFEALVQEVVVANGSATGDGGGILVDGGALYNGSTSFLVTQNSAGGLGGGIACRNGGFVHAKVDILDNIAAHGGGVAADDCIVTVLGEVSGNEATGGNGGGLYARGGSTMKLDRPVLPRQGELANNSAATGGGAYLEDAGTTFELAQGRIHDNAADRGGGVAVEGGAHARVTETWLYGNSAVDGSAVSLSSASAVFESDFLADHAGGSLVHVDGGGELTLALVTTVANDLGGSPTIALSDVGSSTLLASSLLLDGRVFDPPAAGVIRDVDCVAALDLTDFPPEPRPGSYQLAGSPAEFLAVADGSSPALDPGGAAVDFCDGAPWLPTTLDIDGESRVYDVPPAGSARFGILDLGADESRGLHFADHEEGDCSDWSSGACS